MRKMEKHSFPNLQIRITTGILLIILILSLTWLGSWPFTFFSLFIGGLIFYEWNRMIKLEAIYIFLLSSWGGYFLIGLFLLFKFPVWIIFIVLLVVVICLVFYKCLKNAQQNDNCSPKNCWIIGGFIYAVFFAIILVMIRKQELYGFSILCFLYAIVWGTDTGAYFCGCLIGGAKLAPIFSPNKTRTGALGGIFGGCICGFSVAWLLDLPWKNWSYIFVLVFLVSIFSQIGDIAESAIKRRFNVKDSGTILPGHGGIMDRADSLIFAAIFLYAVGLIDGTFDIFK